MRIEKHPILDFERGSRVTFFFNGQPLEGYTNETVSSALLAAGVRTLRHSIREKRPRGFFCGIGRCASCSMTIDGIPNVRSCITMITEGMDVKTQE